MADKCQSGCKYMGEYEIVPDKTFNPDVPPPKIEVVYAFPLTHTHSPAMTAVGLAVTMAPGGMSPPHRHGPAAVSATILHGTAFNKMNDEPTRLLPAGSAWYEAPGCHHRTSANASQTEEMKLLACAVVETEYWEREGVPGIVIVDEEWRYLLEKHRAEMEKVMGQAKA